MITKNWFPEDLNSPRLELSSGDLEIAVAVLVFWQKVLSAPIGC